MGSYDQHWPSSYQFSTKINQRKLTYKNIIIAMLVGVSTLNSHQRFNSTQRGDKNVRSIAKWETSTNNLPSVISKRRKGRMLMQRKINQDGDRRQQEMIRNLSDAIKISDFCEFSRCVKHCPSPSVVLSSRPLFGLIWGHMSSQDWRP